MDRIYLSVSPEEYPEVRASGACWDDASKTWYIREGVAPAMFSRWLEEEQSEAAFGIVSDEAFVVSARTFCVKCRKDIEVICIYCKSGMDADLGDPLSNFTVSNISAMDGALGKALQRWPYFTQGADEDSAEGGFANHCPQCGAKQEEYLLHSEPGDVFFRIATDGTGPVEFTPLEGRVQLSGDYGFEL